MSFVARFLTPLALASGAALAAYGGYGAGLGHAAGAGLPHWVQVAAAGAGGIGLLGLGLWRQRRREGTAPPSFAADLAALERLVPTLRRHPDGLGALQDLIDVLFEACHRPDAARKPEVVRETTRKGGRSHA